MIHIDRIGKCYQLGKKNDDSFWRSLGGHISSLYSVSKSNNINNDFWALRDVSFDIDEGEVVGIVGSNGAGKSTLLKLLARITPPTEGTIRLQGRLASLLEVGTGFQPELTGRENIYLNGAILGMSIDYIRRVFDEIVDFSEVEKFIDTPVKFYSSGMYVRLAFAVAAHMDQEILVLDEVLAVGDIGFQKKCLGKMGEVNKNGKTVIFVSHDLSLVEHMCQRAILLEDGNLTNDGPVTDVISEYRSNILPVSNKGLAYSVDWDKLEMTRVEEEAHIVNIEILDKSYNNATTIHTGDRITIRIHYFSPKHYRAPAFRVKINSWTKNELVRLSTRPISGFDIKDIHGSGYIDLTIESLPLTGGEYSIDIGISREMTEWICNYIDVTNLMVTSFDTYGSGVALENTRGYFVVPHEWKIKYE